MARASSWIFARSTSMVNGEKLRPTLLLSNIFLAPLQVSVLTGKLVVPIVSDVNAFDVKGKFLQSFYFFLMLS